jgi:Protein of unknown function (DUF4236)
MALYLRKAKKIGPFRINLSKSGIGISGGITGARFGINAQGRTYVHGGRHGLYYRKNLGSNTGSNGVNGNAINDVPRNAIIETYHSGNLDKLTDTSSREFVDELQTKANKIELWRWLGLYPATLILIVLAANILFSATDPVAASGYALLGSSALLLGVWTYIMYKLDRRRKSLELHYIFDEELTDVYYSFIEGFNRFTKTNKIWEVLASVEANGTGTNIAREGIKEVSRHKLPTPYLNTNVAIPYLRLKKIELFFLPERLILRRGKKYAAINYSSLTIKLGEKQFTESNNTPEDTEVIDYTWLHANKNGDPDRRYKHNRQLPVCRYSTYHFESAEGLNELLMTSKPAAMDDFIGAIEKMGKMLV